MGQNCCAISRLYIHDSIHEKLIERIEYHTKQLKVGDPSNEVTQIGPMSNLF
jgi:acyl-CoA reductase-like NAD-dependent aldehyde dehydrogenase